MRWIAMLLLTALALVPTSPAKSDTVVFKYVTADGVVSFTDDESRVPAAHEAEAIHVGSLTEYDRFTKLPNGSILKVPAREHALPKTPKRECGAITVRSERRDVNGGAGGEGSFNKRFYIAEDTCGILFDAPYYPDLNSLRR